MHIVKVINPERSFVSEYALQAILIEWLSLQYPNVIAHCDLSGVRVSIGVARKIKRINPHRAYPDVFIAEPCGGYHGLYIELKRKYSDLYTQSGKMRQTKHIKEQAKMLERLRKRGYRATFSVGLEPTQKLISDYLNGKGGGITEP